MSDYTAPLQDIRFTLDVVAGLKTLQGLPVFEEAGDDLVDAILEEGARFFGDVMAPLNVVGDLEGSSVKDAVVTVPRGFSEAYGQYVEGGWNTLACDPDYGGQGLPYLLATAIGEMFDASCAALSLNPMLTLGAAGAVRAHAPEDLKNLYLEKMISGAWTGTMNLTEPQAGSDVGALKTRAKARGDGTYLINGQKIFISWGDHEMTENVIHLVLARLPDAAPGTRGISLFLVPKYLVNADGSLGARNDALCISLEHKLGIHASPTAVMAFGESGDCVGYLLGEENRGMSCMFTMMNEARLNIGRQGLGISERAYQQAADFAAERVQGVPAGAKSRDAAAIIHHPDVRRMLMTMKALTEASRCIVYRTAAATDMAHHHPDADARRTAQGLVDLLTPIAKAFPTEMAPGVASLGIQIHGGMGFVEETGVAQYLRDARIGAIYEGTTGIQGLDLVGRKLGLDGGKHWKALFQEMWAFDGHLPDEGKLGDMRKELRLGLTALEDATNWIVDQGPEGARDVAAGATPYLTMFGMVLGGYFHVKSALEASRRLAAGEGNPDFLTAKIATARFYLEQILPQGTALLGPIRAGATVMDSLSAEAFRRD